MMLKHWLAFFALIALGLALGQLKPAPVAMIEDTTIKTVEPVELDLTPADWSQCVTITPERPLLANPPGKEKVGARTRDGGTT